METGPYPSDTLVAELLERLAGAPGLAEACSIVLDRVAGGGGRAVVVIRQEGEFRGVGRGIPDAAVHVLLAGAADSPLLDWLEADAAELFPEFRLAPFPDFSPFVVLPFLRTEAGDRGVVLLDAAELDERIERIHGVFRRCGGAIARCLAFERLEFRIGRSERQRKMLAGVVAALQSTRCRVAERRAARERDQLNAILENAGAPILVTDGRAKIVLMNRAAERLLVAPAVSAAGGGGASDVRANDTKVMSLISGFLLQGGQRRVEVLELADPATGSARPVEVISSKILDERGEATAIVSVLHDLHQVVENQRLARELRQLNEGLEQRIARATEELEVHNRRLEWQSRELERASRLKSEFLANMSHELRTPLNVLLGYTSLMRDGVYGALTDRHELALAKMHTASTHLLQLINDILDLSKIEAGKVSLHFEEIRLDEVVAEIAEMVEPLLAGSPLALTVDVGADVPSLNTDRTKLKQVLFNLVSNAVKFTESGRIEVRTTAVAGGDRVRIAVADTGVGIRAEDLDIIFEDFRQADQSTTKRHGGTGLGLSITRKLVGLLGGTISVESRCGEGTTFTVELPIHAEGAPDTTAGRTFIAALDRSEPIGGA